MRPDGDGRFCERCQLRVTEVAKLDGDGLDELIAAAENERVCAHFVLDGGRPRTKLGLAAGLVVVALAGCAAPEVPGIHTPIDESALDELIDEGSGAMIVGAVRSTEGFPIAGAVVVLQSVALEQQQERVTNERGFYKFEDLPPGTYTIQVLYGHANVSKVTVLAESARLRAHFKLDPMQIAADGMILLGAVVERPMIDTTSASSTYSSRLIEYE